MAVARATVNGLLQVARENRISMADLKKSSWSIGASGEDQPEPELERAVSKVCDSTSMIEEPSAKRTRSSVAARSASTRELFGDSVEESNEPTAQAEQQMRARSLVVVLSADEEPAGGGMIAVPSADQLALDVSSIDGNEPLQKSADQTPDAPLERSKNVRHADL